MHLESDQTPDQTAVPTDDGDIPLDLLSDTDLEIYGALLDAERDIGRFEGAGVVLHLCGMTLFLAAGSAMAAGGTTAVPAWLVICVVLMIGVVSAGLPVARCANRFMLERPRWSMVIATGLIAAALGLGYGAQEMFSLPASAFAAGWSAGTGLVALGAGTALIQRERPRAEAFRPWIGALVMMAVGFLSF